MIQDILAY